MKSLTKRQAITYFILFILLIGRVWENTAFFVLRIVLPPGATVIPAWFWNFTALATWIIGFNIIGEIPLIVIVLILNQDDLQSLNIDKFSIYLTVFAGLIYVKEAKYGLGIPSGIAVVLFSVYALWKKNLNFDKSNSEVWRLGLIGFTVFALGLFVVSNHIDPLSTEQNIASSLVAIFLPVTEEIMYRGMLWMFLKNLKWNEVTIMFFTAFLFWMSHLNLFFSPFNFWFYIPLLSLILGYLFRLTEIDLQWGT